MTVSSSDWSLNMASGGKPVSLPYSSASASVFSQDGRYDIVILSYQVRVYFVSTRQCIRTIDIDLSDVTDVKLDVLNSSHIVLFKSSGEIITLNWKDKINQPIVSTSNIETEWPILSVAAIRGDAYYVIIGKKDKKASASPHTRYVVRISRDQLSVMNLAEINNVTKYAISPDSHKLAFLTSNNDTIVVDLSKQDQNDEEETDYAELSQETIPFIYKSPVTSLAVSNDSVVAVGTSAGAIQLLYGGLTSDKPQGLLKWHIDQVRALQFTPDNNYLLSGGMEKVLVFWQLETGKTQFLPRLNGSIERISLDNNKNDYYSLMLKVSSSGSDVANDEDTYEILVLSAVDLVSRLSINSIRPKLANNIKQTLLKTKKKFAKSETTFDKSKLKHDYTSIFEIHPKTKNLYFPNEAVIQAYDLIKNEQSFVQTAAPLLSTGKVRSENKLLDPTISLLSFTQDGQWMCTFDSISTSEVDNLLSKNDKQYALKFWKFIESSPSKNDTNSTNSVNNKQGYWELSTKIIDPHGNSNPILSLTPAPLSYHHGLAFLTADNKGGLRIWRPRIPKEIYQTVKQGNNKLQQTAWTLRKSKPCGALVSDAIDTCWSDDGSVIILGHECSITTFNTQTFEEIPNDSFRVPALSGSRIRSLSILDDYLIVLSKTRITSFNLLSGESTDLVANVNTTIGGKNLIAIDPVKKLICLGVNYYSNNADNFGIKSKILVFKPDELTPVHVSHHNQGISSIRQFHSSFIFVDLDSRIGIISSTNDTFESSTESVPESDLANDMNNMLLNAQAAADVMTNRNVSFGKANGKQLSDDLETDDSVQINRVIDVNTFQPMFENLEGAQIDTLFERIMKIIK